MRDVDYQIIIFVIIFIAIASLFSIYKVGYNNGHEEGYVEAAEVIFENLEDLPDWEYFTPSEPLKRNMYKLFDNYPHRIDTDVIYDNVTSAGHFSFKDLLESYMHEYGIYGLAEYPN